MTNTIKNYMDPSSGTKVHKVNFSQSSIHSKMSRFIDPIFTKVSDLSQRHLGSYSAYFIVNQEDTVIHKTLKVSSWIFGISPAILFTFCVYDALADLYHQHFQGYSKVEESSGENAEPFKAVSLPKEQPSIVEDMPESTIQEELESRSLDTSKVAETPEETLQDQTLSIPTMEQPKELHNETIEDTSETLIHEESESNSSNTPEEKTELSEELSTQTDDTPLPINQEAPQSIPNVEIFKEVPNEETNDSSKTLNNQEELEKEADNNSFEIINTSAEVQEEMNNAPKMISHSTSLWKRIQTLNPFTRNVVISSDPTIQENIQEPCYKDFEMLDPIIVDHKDTQIATIKKILMQLKRDLPRNNIFINNKRFTSLQEFIDYFGIHLDENKTDILPGYHPIIPKIFDYSTQTSLNFGFENFLKHNKDKLFNSLMAMSSSKDMQFHIKPTSHISWNSDSPEKAEIIAESLIILFNPSESTYSSSKPLAIYKIIVKTNFKQTEVSWQLIEKPNEPLIEPRGLQKAEIDYSIPDQSDTDSFTEIDELSEELKREASELKDPIETAIDFLKKKKTSGLHSGITRTYLNFLKKKYPFFTFDDQLMFPGSFKVDKTSKTPNIDILSKNLNAIGSHSQSIVLPFLVNGWKIKHAVVAVINPLEKTIEYFDPKGQPRVRPKRTETWSGMNVFDFLLLLGKKVISPSFSKDKILYNEKNIPQKFFDDTNCGVFCLQFIEERISHSFDDIESGISNRIRDPILLRDQLAENLNNNSLDTIQDSFECIESSDVANMPSDPDPTTRKNHLPPILFSPNNPFHLEKYSYSLQVIEKTLAEFSSDTHLKELRSIIENKDLNSRDKYRQYVDAIRKLLGDTTLESNTRTTLERVCFAAFTTNIMTPFIEEFLKEATSNMLKSASKLSMHTIADAISEANNELMNSPSKKELFALWSQKLAGEVGLNFDPTKYSNIPEVRSIHTVKSPANDPYDIIYMRHGTPTIETGSINPAEKSAKFITSGLRNIASAVLGTYNATTIPEYNAFLNRARDLNQPVFYVNHQKMVDETSAEYGRSQAIQNHEITHPKHFFFMTLPLDGVVLNHVQNTDQWKRELIDSLMQEKNGFRLPSALKNDFIENNNILEEQFKDLLDKLHTLYFANKPLSHTDQRTLLMIFYSYLKDFVKDRYHIQIMVSACKDNKDRGNATASVDEAIYNLRLGREDNSSALYDLYIRALAPFIIKYEPIVSKRLELLTSVLQHIATLTESQKQAIKQFQINDFQILDQRVPR